MAASNSSHSRHTQCTQSTNVTSVTSKRRSSAYDVDFEQYLVDHNIYPNQYDYADNRLTPEPGNINEIRQRLAVPRASLSPSRFSKSHFRDFIRKNARVISEGKVMSRILPVITGDPDIPNKENLRFSNLDSITGGTTVAAQPDFYDGARPEDLHEEVRTRLNKTIIPTKHAGAPVAPNFFLEAKAPSGGADVARRQACLDGAYGARAMHSLQNYDEEQRTYDGNTYAFSSIFHTVTSTLQLYAHHMTAPTPPGGQPDYHMTKVKSYDMTGDYETFVAGAGAFRNLRELAKEHRDALILSANAKSRRHGRSKSTGNRAPQEAAPSPDELGYATQDVNEDHTLPGYLYPEDDQQDQSQASMPYDALADPQTSITTSFTSSLTSCETHPKHTGDSDSLPASTDWKKRDLTEHKASHHTAGLTHWSGSEKKDHRSGRKSRPAGSDWEWDDDMREYKWWNKTRWEYWDEESQSRKYFDG